MEEEIVQIVDELFIKPFIDNYECAKKISEHILEFIDFLRDSCYGDGRGGWLLRTTDSDMGFNSSDELYLWWIKNVKK